MISELQLTHSLAQAVSCAQAFRGATSPNPPVGAVALDSEGRILALGAHERAGTAHAEARVLADCEKRGLLDQIHTLVVTLEPCNHHGRTPPCTEAILRAGVRQVVFAERDPNPRVAGGGSQRLREAGLEVRELSTPESRALIAPFAQWSVHRIPYVTVKTAHLPGGSMIPPPGRKTFTSESSLELAHRLRKRADAILTGSGTVLADQPEFTVRRVPDHPDKKRWIGVLDRRKRTPLEWVKSRENNGFHVFIKDEYLDALRHLGELGALEVLVEAGPSLSESILKSRIWNEHVVITQGTRGDDRVEVRKCLPELLKN